MTTNELALLTAPIIFSQEGGYNSVNRDDNGALSIGKLQWHANRALELLLKIVRRMGKNNAITYIGESLYNEITDEDTDWSSRVVNEYESNGLKKLLQTAVSKEIQDQIAIDNICAYINVATSNGLVDNQALIYFADIYNQSPARSTKLLKDLVNKAKQANRSVSLLELHNATLAEPILGQYATRRTTVYSKAAQTPVAYIVIDGKVVPYGDTSVIQFTPVTTTNKATEYVQTVTAESVLNARNVPNISSYKGNSIVDALKSVGADSSFKARKNLYNVLGFTDTYVGTAEQNSKLLNTLRM